MREGWSVWRAGVGRRTKSRDRGVKGSPEKPTTRRTAKRFRFRFVLGWKRTTSFVQRGLCFPRKAHKRSPPHIIIRREGCFTLTSIQNSRATQLARLHVVRAFSYPLANSPIIVFPPSLDAMQKMREILRNSLKREKKKLKKLQYEIRSCFAL